MVSTSPTRIPKHLKILLGSLENCFAQFFKNHKNIQINEKKTIQPWFMP
jgi:hypothetical protein